MKYTSNYNLKKPEGTDIVNIEDLNYNADILDQKLKEVENKANNAPPNSVNDSAIGTRTPDQTQVPTSPGSGTLSQIFSWLANRIKAITGKTNWWDAPPTTLQAAKNHIDSAAPHSGHETPSGAQAKANAALNSAKAYTDQEVGEVAQELATHKAAAAPHTGHETPAGAQAKAEAAAGAVQAALDAHKAEKATQDTLGHIKVGQGLEIESDGTLNVNAGGGVPSGLIAMWSGEATSIPDGWALCDGDNGTPDLRDRFIVGAGGDYSVGDTGGEAEVTLTTAQLPSHSHGSGSLSTSSAGSHSHGSGTLSTNTTGAHTHGTGINTPGDFSFAESGEGVTVYGFIQRELMTSSAGSHSHSISGSTSSAGSHSHSISGTTGSAGSGQAHENRPPYYALAFIMKL